MFQEPKVAQMAAFLLDRAGGRLDILKLMKLMYLADREAMDRFGSPISFDNMVSMPHGPVLSRTLDYMNGTLESVPGGWDDLIRDREGHVVSLKEGFVASRDQFALLSDADIDVLDAIWNKYGTMTGSQLRNFTHSHCTEWKDPDGSSYPISERDVFLALGRSAEVAQELAEAIQAERAADRLLARL